MHSRDASPPRRGAPAVDQARAGHLHPRAGAACDGDVVVRGGAAVGEPDAGDDHVHGRFDDDESAEEPDERVQAEVQGESAGGGEGGGGGETEGGGGRAAAAVAGGGAAGGAAEADSGEDEAEEEWNVTMVCLLGGKEGCCGR